MEADMILSRNQKYTAIAIAIGFCFAAPLLFFGLPFFWWWVMRQPEDDPSDRG